MQSYTSMAKYEKELLSDTPNLLAIKACETYLITTITEGDRSVKTDAQSRLVENTNMGKHGDSFLLSNTKFCINFTASLKCFKLSRSQEFLFR